MPDTIAGLSRFLDDEGVGNVRELIGALRYEAFGPTAAVDAPGAYGPPDPDTTPAPRRGRRPS